MLCDKKLCYVNRYSTQFTHTHMSIPGPATDSINDITIDPFTATYVQHHSLSGSSTLDFPCRVGRLVVPFHVECDRNFADLTLAASTHDVREGEEAIITPPKAMLCARRVCESFIGITMSINAFGVSGNVILDDGHTRHYYTCSAAWNLNVGSFECFEEVPRILLCVTVCFGWLLGGLRETFTAPPTPMLCAPLHLPQLEDVSKMRHQWPLTSVLSITPVSGPIRLPTSFARELDSSCDYVAEGWAGTSTECWMTLSDWFARFCTVRDAEIETWREWLLSQIQIVNQLLVGTGCAVENLAQVPSGQSTSRILTQCLRLGALADGINSLRCGIEADFTSNSGARGCRIMFPFDMHSLIITSNGSFDSSPFPKTAALQAHLLASIVTAAQQAPPSSGPAAVTFKTENSGL